MLVDMVCETPALFHWSICWQLQKTSIYKYFKSKKCFTEKSRKANDDAFRTVTSSYLRSFCVFTILCIGTGDYAVCKTDLRKATERLSATPSPPTQTIHSNSKLPLPFALACRSPFNTSYNTYFHRAQLWRDWLLRKPHRTSKWHVFKDTYPILILQPLGKRHASSFHRESRSYQGCTRIPRHPTKQEKKI